jgi:hypothetical protein
MVTNAVGKAAAEAAKQSSEDVAMAAAKAASEKTATQV